MLSQKQLDYTIKSFHSRKREQYPELRMRFNQTYRHLNREINEEDESRITKRLRSWKPYNLTLRHHGQPQM